MCLRGCVTPQTLVLFLAVSSLLFIIAIVTFAAACNQCVYPYNSRNHFQNIASTLNRCIAKL